MTQAHLTGSRGILAPDLPAVRWRRVSHSAVLVVASFGAFLAFLDSTIVNVAFPSIQHAFPRTALGSLSWVLNGYNIVFAAFLIAAGRVADLLGRRRTFRLGVLLFTLASLGCAASGSVDLLVAMRALQAVGSALLVPASLALVIEAFPGERRSHAIGLWGASAALAAGLGPPLGGALVSLGGWRLAFLVNLPLGAAAWLSARTLLVESRAPGRRRMPDLRGAAFIAAALGALTLGLVQGDAWGWSSAGTLGAFGAAVAFAGAFAWSSTHHPSPILDPALLRLPAFPLANGLTVLAGAGFYAYLLTHILWLTYVWHYSVLTAGLALAPGAFVAAAVAGVLGSIVDRYGARVVVAPGAVVWAGAYWWYVARVGVHPDFLGQWLPGQVLSGLGVGATLPVLASGGMAAVPGGRYATASAVLSSARQLGGVLGISVVTVILGRISFRDPHGIVLLRHAWLFSALCFAAVGVAATRLQPVRGDTAVLEDRLATSDRITTDTAATPLDPYPTYDGTVATRPVPCEDDGAALTTAQLLATVPMFAPLGAATLARIAGGLRPTRVEAGEWVFEQGDRADALYVVSCGSVEIVKDGVVVSSVTRGGVVGELGLLTRAPRSASARARRDTELIRVTRRRFDDAVGGDASALRSLAAGLAQQVQASAPVAVGRHRARIVGVLAADRLVPVAVVTDLLVRALADQCRVVSLAGAAATPAALEAAERSADLVLVPIEEQARSATDREFVLRQADRVLVVASSTAPVGVPGLPAGRDVDLLLLGPAPTAEVVAAWWDELDPVCSMCAMLSTDALAEVADRYSARLTGRSVGLVLSGGGARALAHVGVIEELVAAGIRIDRVGGCSMGAFIGALVACGLSVDEIDERIYAEYVRRNPLSDLTVPRYGLVRGRRGEAMMDRVFGRDLLIEQLPLSFYAVATDLMNRELMTMRRGPVWDAVGASVNIPGVLPAREWGGRILVDGGVLDNLPVAPMLERDEGPVIAVNVVGSAEGRRPADGRPLRIPTITETLMRSMTMAGSASLDRHRDQLALLIMPEHGGIGLLEFHQYERIREQGRIAARDALARIGGRNGLVAVA